MFTQKHGGHDTKTTTLFILLTITFSATAHKGAIALGYNTQALAEAAITLGKNLTNYKANSVLVQDLNAANDINATGSIPATAYYGNGAGLTNVAMNYTDLNANFVPYIGADFDTNMGTYDLRAEELNSMRLGVKTVAYVQGRTYTTGLTSSVDLNVTTNGTSTGVGFSADSNAIWLGKQKGFDNNGTHWCLGGC